jgi:SAM-dependent methyltransferase
MTAFSFSSFLSHVTSPGPRYLLRLNLLSPIFRDILSGDKGTLLEVGTGAGDVAAFIGDECPAWQISIVESSDQAMEPLRLRFRGSDNVTLFHQRLDEMNSTVSFDVMLAFEVLEHIEDDELVLADMHKRLSSRGHLVISVPAYMSKWQTQDLVSGHVRRYEENELRSKLHTAGFDVLEFVDYGFPLTSLMRPIREIFYRGTNKENKNQTLEAKTDLSGVNYRALKTKHTTLVSLLITPFYVLQRIFQNFRIGDGFIVVARKKD